MPIRVVHFGLGPIGAGVVHQVARRKGFKPVGGIDIDPAKVGKDLGIVAGLDRPLRLKVSDDPVKVIRQAKPDVVVLCTSSSLKGILPQLETVLNLKTPIVSTTEEMAYPFRSKRRLAKTIDELAKKAMVAVVGTGVNPGFIMDALPIALSGICERVDSIRIERIQDAGIRRLPFQRKIGAGLSKEEFGRQSQEGKIRHVGFRESIDMIADTFHWKLDRITDEVRPKIAVKKVSSAYAKVNKGFVSGIVQDGIGYRNGKALITLHLEAYLGAPDSHDATTIEGSPRLTMRVDGVHGDISTISMTVNAIPRILTAPPGLRSMRDLILPSFYSG